MNEYDIRGSQLAPFSDPDGGEIELDGRAGVTGVEAGRDGHSAGEPWFMSAIREGNVGANAFDSGRHLKWFVLRFYEPQIALLTRLLMVIGLEFKRFTFIERSTDGQSETKPLFPGYLFIQFDPVRDYWQQLLRIPPVIGLLGGEKPIPLAPGIFEALVDTFENIVRPQAPRFPIGVAEGDTVRIRGGALQNIEGVVTQIISRDRVRVSVMMFGRLSSVTLAPSSLKVVL